MKKISLDEETKNKINEYVKEVVDIPGVTGVYMTVYYDLIRGEDVKYILISTVIDHSVIYNEKLYGCNRSIEEDMEDAHRYYILKNAFIGDFAPNGIDLSLYKYYNFYSSLINSSLSRIEDRLRSDLVSSTILFDRFGDLEKVKEELSKDIKPYENYFEVENMEPVKSRIIPIEDIKQPVIDISNKAGVKVIPPKLVKKKK